MKIFYSFFAFFIFISSSACTQNFKDTLPPKVSEQKEIKATNELKKKLEQKQLSAPPERIAGTKTSWKSTDKRKNKKCKPQTKRNRYLAE